MARGGNHGRGPSILPLSLRLTRVRGWSALPELVAGAELELQLAGGNVQPNVRPPLDFLVLSPLVPTRSSAKASG